MSLGASTPIEVAVSGPNLVANREFAEKVKERLQKIPSLRDVQFGQALDYPHRGCLRESRACRTHGRQDVGSLALAGRGHVIQPIRRAELLGRPEQRCGLPNPGADSANEHELAWKPRKISR
jgi:hypothetical protein